jgi:hypothetical protein
MSQNAGEKGLEHFEPLDPPSRWANKQYGQDHWEDDQSPVVGVAGRETNRGALQVRRSSSKTELKGVVE